jgi:hypothetical protein
LRTPLAMTGIFAAIALIAVWLSRRTTWSPAPTDPIRQRRKAGQIYRSGFRVYRRRWALFVGIGLISIPLGGLAAIAEQFLMGITGLSALTHVAASDPVVGALAAVLFGAFTTLVAATLAYAACAQALDRIDSGEQVSALAAYKGILRSLPSVAWATLRITIVTGLLLVTVVGIPFAVVYLIRKTLTLQSIVIERRRGTSGLKRSGELVRGRGLRVLAIGALLNGTVALVGPVIGVVMMFITPASLGLINFVSALVYVLVLPAAGIALALLFYDLRLRHEGLSPSRDEARAPAGPGVPAPQAGA